MIDLDDAGTAIKESNKILLRGEEINQKYLHERFLEDGLHGFEKDVGTCFIDKFDTSDPHKRQYYWLRPS